MRESERLGDAPAVIVADTQESVSHAELDEGSRRLVTVLDEAGLQPGSVVVLLAAPGRAAFEVFAAARRAGLQFAALDHSLGLEELAYVVNDSGAEALFVAEDLGALAGPLVRLTPSVRLRVFLGSGLPDHLDYSTCLQAPPSLGPDHAASTHVHYSDGTIARPVAARLTRSNLAEDQLTSPVLAALAPHHRVSAKTVLFSTTSLADPVAAQLYASVLILGGTVVTTRDAQATSALAALGNHPVTLAHFVPGALQALLRLPEEMRRAVDVESLAAVVHSSAPCPRWVKQSLIAWMGPVVHEFYGGAEHEALTFIDADSWRWRPGSIGRGVRGPAQACDAEGGVLAPGEPGVIWFATDLDGHREWVTLGDIGWVDPDGYVFLSGATDAEEVVRLHPGVADAALVRDVTGTRLTLVVQPGPGVAADHRLEREVVAMLAPADVPGPVEVEFVGKLPRTGSGRLVRRRLRASYADPRVSPDSTVPQPRRPS